MSLLHRIISRILSITPVQALIFFSFVLWMFAFRGFLYGNTTLMYDAVSYYDHTKFLVDNLMRGVFPLWDPVWFGGSPNAFFLRRIGAYNPFYGFIALFNKMGMSYHSAYILFLEAYFFLGMVGFFLLAKKILKDEWAAFCAFGLLTFSALGTRLFDSYLHIVFVPLIWFFLFLVQFASNPQRYSFLGMTFCTMILLTTYIPFYFIVIVATFILSFVCIYSSLMKEIFKNILRFLRGNYLLVILCLAALGFSCLPGIQFFREAKEGTFVMPQRYSSSTVQSSLGVADQSVKPWSVVEEIMYASFFTDLKRIHFKGLYLPLFFYILVFIGCWTRFNRMMAFFLLWAGVLFIIITPLAAPVYKYLYGHVFFFKYFRNLHFFLWFVLIQIAALLIAEQFRIIKDYLKDKSRLHLFIIFLVHGGVAFYLWRTQTVLLVTWCVVGISLIFFISLFGGIQRSVTWKVGILLLFSIALEPMQVYQYFQKNEMLYETFQYDAPHWEFDYTRGESRTNGSTGSSEESGVYYGTQWFNLIWRKINPDILWEYYRHKFVIYDHVEYLDSQDLDFKIIEKTFQENRNLAYVFDKKVLQLMDGKDFSGKSAAVYIEESSSDLKVLKFSTNFLQLKTNFKSDKFLVYNDNFYPGWHASINRKPVELWQANVSFKGVWIPAGEQTVEFRFGDNKATIQNYGLLIIFLLMAIGIIFFKLGKAC